ncbi:MAG: PAS domain-containing protein [Verrucomicrobiae bacterium]|nr:PAS domain-containing protein [Verrucomicrobiae bacterium]
MALKRATRTKSGFLDKVLDRLNRLDPVGVQTVVERLQRERALLGTLFNTIEDGIVVLDRGGKVTYLNQAAARLLSVALDGAVGQPLERIFGELDPAVLQAVGEGRVVRRELEIQFPQPRLLRVFAAPIEDNPEAGLALVLHDATEHRHQTREAVEAERGHALTLLAASVAHEIGNPLNALHIHLQLIERELRKLRAAADPENHGARDASARLQKYLDVAKGEVARLDYITTDFLRAMRPSAPQFRDASVNDVVQEVVTLLGPELENRGLNVVTRLGRGLPDVSMDSAQIKQALLNLVKNAMQAMTRGGTLTLSTGRTLEHVWIAVSDTGAGIAADQLGRLFQPFYTTKARGTGLGLMTVQRIVRDHRGEIDVDSEVGRGTTFRLQLPHRKRLALALPPGGSPAPAG